MSDAKSALPGAQYDGLARITAMGPRGMITLKGDLASTALKNAATGIAGVDFPDQGRANCVGERGICWMAPDELLVLAPYAEVQTHLASIARTLGTAHHLAADVSDARALFLIEGEAARDVLGKLTPADLSPETFRPGTFRRTRLGQVPAAFWMRDTVSFELISFRSVAPYVFGILSSAANPDADPAYH